jgi:hypothetical protein
MSTNDLSRRDFLLRFTAVGAVGVGSAAVLSACGGGGEGQAQAPAAAPSAPETTAPASAGACGDLSGLTEQEVAMRPQLQYVAETPDASKPCDTCALYITPAAGAACGGCNLIKGPIAPKGYCVSWAPKQT